MRTSSRALFVAAAIMGSFCVYCVQSATQGSNPTANADCTAPATPPEFKELGNGLTAAAGGTSDAIDVSQYREIVLQATASSKSCRVGSVYPRFRQTDEEVFAETGQSFYDSPGSPTPIVPGGRIRVDGPSLQIQFTGCALWRVVGVK